MRLYDFIRAFSAKSANKHDPSNHRQQQPQVTFCTVACVTQPPSCHSQKGHSPQWCQHASRYLTDQGQRLYIRRNDDADSHSRKDHSTQQADHPDAGLIPKQTAAHGAGKGKIALHDILRCIGSKLLFQINSPQQKIASCALRYKRRVKTRGSTLIYHLI